MGNFQKPLTPIVLSSGSNYGKICLPKQKFVLNLHPLNRKRKLI